MTNDAVVAQAGQAATHPSGITGHRDDHKQVWSFYIVTGVVLIIAGLVVVFTVPDGVWMGVMVMMGAVIILALLSSAAVPHLVQVKSHNYHY